MNNEIYETDRLILRAPDKNLAKMVLEYYQRNQIFLEEWEPVRNEEFYTKKYHEEQLENDITLNLKRNQLSLWILKKGEEDKVIGSIGFTNIVWGSFLSCYLGYKLDQEEINQGYMTEALNKGIEIMFDEYGLHRIEANIIPRNIRSLRVTEKLGFQKEGISPKYLNINGIWEDHIHMVLLNEKL